MAEPDLSVNLGGIELDSPVLAASGPFGYGHEYRRLVDFSALGALIVKGVSSEPWAGNPPPRLAETAGGLLNSVGLQNPGLQSFLTDHLPRLQNLPAKLIVNVIGRTKEEYAAVAAGLDGAPGVSGLELNISCPNLKAGGMAFGTNARATASVVSAARAKTSLPLLVKLSPNVTSIAEIAAAAEAAGADALSLVNTLSGMLIDTAACRPLLANTFGGLSGPAIMPVALKMVWQAAEKCSIPILGMGGINSADDALQFIMAGAAAVAVGTGIFYDHNLPARIVSGLRDYLSDNSVPALRALSGAARKGA